jgi:hypothetical protein
MGVRTVTFRFEDGRYVFATRDREIWIANRDKAAAASFFHRMAYGFAEKGVKLYVEAYEDLGVWRKPLKDVGVACRLRVGHTPPALDPIRWQMPGDPVPKPPPPIYSSWEDYLAKTCGFESCWSRIGNISGIKPSVPSYSE